MRLQGMGDERDITQERYLRSGTVSSLADAIMMRQATRKEHIKVSGADLSAAKDKQIEQMVSQRFPEKRDLVRFLKKQNQSLDQYKASLRKEAFADSEGLISTVPLVHAHIFKYSPRPGTPAAEMADQVSPQVKAGRAAQLAAAAERVSQITAGRMLGKEVTVLAETGDGSYEGLADNYVRTAFSGPAGLAGRFCRVRVAGVGGEVVVGEYLGETSEPR
jgi:hypothetical protein